MLRRFTKCAEGGTAILFATAIVGVIGAAGMSVDFIRALNAKTKLQEALDAALTAGAAAQVANAGNVSTVINQVFQNNWHGHDNRAASITFSINPTGEITGNAAVDIPAMLTAAVGFRNIPISVRSGVAFGAGSAEIALVLDTTGSMNGAKLDGAKAAAKQLVDEVYATPGSSSRVKVGLVPFANYVNVGMSNRNAPWMSVPADGSTTTEWCRWDTPVVSSSNCRQVTGTCSNDGTPYSCSWTECDNVYGNAVWRCDPVTTTQTWNGCAGSRAYPADMQATVTSANPVPGVMNVSCPTELKRLTQNKTAVKADIDAMTASGETFIHSGVIWGWRVLSPGAPFSDGEATGVKKVMVLMTDGSNTKSPSYPSHENWDAAQANSLLVETCTNAKAAGVEIYAIAFDVADPTITTLLGNCASGPPYFYTATTVSELASAFQSIGRSLTQVRMLQ